MEEFEREGLIGQKDFISLVVNTKLPYVCFEQTQETFSPSFYQKAKRPDLMIAPEPAQLAAIDVKRKRPGFWTGPTVACVGLNRLEIEKLREFERVSGIPSFIAFFDGWNCGRRDLCELPPVFLDTNLSSENKPG
jgi:hypothetical protein